MKTKTIILIISFIVVAIIAFLSGRATSVTYVDVPGETVTDTFYSEELIPYEVLVPAKPNLPQKPDTQYIDTGKTIIKEVLMKVDTAKIIANYIELRKYNKQMFDNEDGKLVVDAQIQYNELIKLEYTFTPVEHKVVLKRTIEPFISTSYNSFGFVEAGGGLYMKNFGLEGKYVTNFSQKGFEVGIHYKF